MGPGLLAYDCLYWTLATLLYGAAAAAAVQFGGILAPMVGWPLALFPAALFGVVALIALVGFVSLACPRPRPGKYPLMRGAVFWGWLFRSLLRRILFLPGVRWLLFTSNVLRYCALTALGAKVAFSSNMSADVDLLDPWLLTVEPGATLGARCIVSGHYIDGGRLVLGEVRIGARALLAAEVLVGPGTTVGEDASVKARAALAPHVQVGERANIGGDAVIDAGARVGNDASVGTRAYVGQRAVVPDGAKVEPGTSFSAGAAASTSAA